MAKRESQYAASFCASEFPNLVRGLSLYVGNELPDRQRLAVALRFVMDLSIEQTAERMGVSSDAIRSLTKRATATLREHLSTQADVATEVHDG